MSSLGSLTWPDAAAVRPLLLVPVGSVEQHGPHLPLDTDTRIAAAVADDVAHRCGALVAPALAYGASGEHAGFPGTLSLGNDVLEEAVVELVRSADHFAGVVLVNGHGGNSSALGLAVQRCGSESRRVLLTHCGIVGGDAHAGRVETSLLLHLAPELVRLDRAEAGETRPWTAIRDEVVSKGVGAVAPNGVLGDPTGADPTEGAEWFARICDRIHNEVQEWGDGN